MVNSACLYSDTRASVARRPKTARPPGPDVFDRFRRDALGPLGESVVRHRYPAGVDVACESIEGCFAIVVGLRGHGHSGTPVV